MGMFPWLHIFGGDCRMGEDICEGLETVCEARRRTGDFGIAARGQKWFIVSCKIKIQQIGDKYQNENNLPTKS